jgi:hypothetical protein
MQLLPASTKSNIYIRNNIDNIIHTQSIIISGKVAVFCHTDVIKYKDLVNLFQTAEKEFGGVDVSLIMI